MTWMLLACGSALPELGALPEEQTLGEDPAPPETDTGEPTGAPAEWTFMVFVNGDNDLERWGLVDLYEMEEAGSSDRVHVLVQLDRSDGYDTSEGDWTGARRYRVTGDEDPTRIDSPVLEDLGEVDSGDPQTVVDFARWSATHFPAKRYALVLWDHGNGWSIAPESPSTKAVSYDYSAGSSISVAQGELEQALSGVTEAVGQPLDLLGMDACIMQTWEVAWVAQPYARYSVASQDYEDVTGWAYDTALADLLADPTMEGDELGDAIARRFSESGDSTQSVLDLERLPALTASLDAFASAVLDRGLANEIRAGARSTQGFDGEFSDDHDLIDLLEHVGLRDAAAAEAASAAREKARDVVVANYTNGEVVAEAFGLSIFSPVSGDVPSLYLDADWAAETLWDDLLTAGATYAAP